MLNPLIARATIVAANAAMILVRAPHEWRSRSTPVVRSLQGLVENVLLTLAWGAVALTVVWVFTPVFAFARYPLHAAPFAVGVTCLVAGLWLLHRAHVDLGTNWSITLRVRENHRLVTRGVYRHVRHPMYLAFVVYAVGQALVVPNWLVGPSYGVAMGVLLLFRLGAEERMMREQFGEAYAAYAAGTKRLIPGVW